MIDVNKKENKPLTINGLFSFVYNWYQQVELLLYLLLQQIPKQEPYHPVLLGYLSYFYLTDCTKTIRYQETSAERKILKIKVCSF